MESNFRFLEKDFPVLARFGKNAEAYLYSDSNSCLMKLGMIGETIVNLMFTYDKIPLPGDNSAVERINVLAREGLLSKDLTDILHALRKARNKAVHNNYESISDGKALLEMAHSLCQWFMQTYGDWNYQSRKFVLPLKEEPVPRQDKAAEEREEIRLTEQAERAAAATAPMDKTARRRQAGRAANQRQKSEAETRYLIDQQLRQVGWEADTENLRYSRGVCPAKGRNLAIAEWPTDSRLGSRGRADYALFIGLKLVGIIEAKAEHRDIPSVLDYQGKDYPRCIRAEDAPYQVGTWGEYKVPFTFATNGRPYLEQYRTKSGVWFLDLREPSNAPKALRGWIGPEGLLELLGKDVEKGNQALRATPYDLLRDKDGLNLREYQIRAIRAVEEAVMDGRRSALLAMATGTGKTRTVLGLIYRFLETKRFRRILFLVDRTALGEQAQDVFKEVKLAELMTLDELYNIKGLQDQEIERETRVHIATVQGMVRRLLYNDGEGKMPAVTDYDLVIVDEAHRGYFLDQEMTEAEALYRDQRDYQSKYRSVIEYFDAVKIALTATPALQTTEIFGQPVFKYTYREAVIEGYLVDHDAPHNLVTRLRDEGIHYKAGDTVTVYDPVTGELTNSELLEDELDFDIEDFNKKVVSESFNRTVLEEIARDIDPENVAEQGKTLIYAVNDAHADMIVDILKNIYSESGVDNGAVMKITGSVGGRDPKKVQEAIKRFKNEKYPSVAVTVDLLTTGIDVPEITTLVFLRRVKSRILFEQMLGRATRLCPKIHKTHFEIYDPVGVYESLDPVNTMKPVTANPTATYAQLLDGLEEMEDKGHVKNQVNQIIAKLQRQRRDLSAGMLEHFASMTGGQDPSGFIADLLQKSPEEAKAVLLARRDLFELLQGERAGGRPVVVSDAEDELLSHTRGYGCGSRPEDYLDAFSEYVRSNMNEIAALHVVCTRPRDLTRESLKNLRLILDREGFTVRRLNTAVSELTNEEITADIISLIRRYAIGAELISHEARIRRAVDKLKKAHRFTKQELSWLSRMEKYLMEESVLNVGVFDEDDRFKNAGGFGKLNKVFQNQLESVVLELNEYLYDDGGRGA